MCKMQGGEQQCLLLTGKTIPLLRSCPGCFFSVLLITMKFACSFVKCSDCKGGYNMYKLSVSTGNRKMGAIPSVSLPPIVTCPAGCPCSAKCYAAKMCRIYPNVKKAYQNNLDLLNTDWDGYWNQTRAAVKMHRFFRFHVSGDIPNAGYFKELAITAKQCPHTEILVFTKQYEIVNHYIDVFGELPSNLRVIFSRWDSAWNVHIHNPHNLPMSAVIFKNVLNQIKFEKICGGNCSECACQGVGCWELKPGETIAFYEH